MKYIWRALALVCLCVSLLNFASVSAQEELVYVVPLDGEITQARFLALRHAFKQAEKEGAATIILVIDTFGGTVDASDKIKNLIYDTAIPVHAFVKKAISGGAYVALACDNIYMRTGSTLGAVEPVAGGEPVTDEKTLSVIQSQMETMAERRGRDPEIAAAMVRKEIGIPGLVEPGKLLTLTAARALEVGYAEGIVDRYTEIPPLLGMESPRFTVYEAPWSVRFAIFVQRPVVSAIILAIALAALVIEILTAGFGVAGIISILAFSAFFGSGMVVGLAQWEYVALFILGIILLLTEAFIPGFGVVGIAGLICIVLGIILSASTFAQGLVTLAGALLLAALMVIVAFRLLRKSPAWNRIVLSTAETKERGYVGPIDLSALVGQQGVAATPLRPSGIVALSNGERVDAITEGLYIAAGTEVEVTGVSSGSVVVSPKNRKE